MLGSGGKKREETSLESPLALKEKRCMISEKSRRKKKGLIKAGRRGGGPRYSARRAKEKNCGIAPLSNMKEEKLQMVELALAGKKEGAIKKPVRRGKGAGTRKA